MRSLVLIAFCIGVASAASIAIPEIRSSASASASASVTTGGTTRSITDTQTDFDSSTGSSASASASASASSTTSFSGKVDVSAISAPCIEIDEAKISTPCTIVSTTADAFVTSDGKTISVNDESLGWKEITKEQAESTPCAPGTFRRKIIINPETGERTCLPAFELKKTLAPCVPCAPTIVYKPRVRPCYVPQTKCVPTYRVPCPPVYRRVPCVPTYRRPCPPVYRRRAYANACATSYVRRDPCVVRKVVPPSAPCTPTVIKIEKPAVQVSTQAVACAQATPETETKVVAPCETPEVKVPEIDCDLPTKVTDLISKIGSGASASAFASASSSSSTKISTQ